MSQRGPRFVVRVSNTAARGYRAIVTDTLQDRRGELVVFSAALGLAPREARVLASEAAAQYEAWWRGEGAVGAARAQEDARRRCAAQAQELAFRQGIRAVQREYAEIGWRERDGARAFAGLDTWAADRETQLREARDRCRAGLTGDEGIRW